jgi:PKD repeat protein
MPDWIEFGQTNPSAFRAPDQPGVYDIRCEATNQNGTTTVDSEAAIVVLQGSAPVANFTLSAARFDTDAADYPTPWVRILSNDSTNDPDTHLWRLEPPGISFSGEIPPPFQLPGKGTYTISLTVANAHGSDIKGKRISVLSGTELRALWPAPDPQLLATFPGVESRLSGSWSSSLSEDPNLST